MSTEPAGISDEKIAGLLRLTGPRPAVPVDRTERVKAATHDRWRAEVSGRSRRRRVRVAAALAAAAAIVLVAGLARRLRVGAPAPQAPAALVEAVTGPVFIRPAQGTATAPSALRAGDAVPPGSGLQTDENGRLALRLPSGGSLRLDVDTRIEALTDRSLTLVAGAVYVDSGGRRAPGAEEPERAIEIHTPAGRIREIGTQFEVRLGEATVRLRVREGLVSVDRPSGGLQVTSGRELQLDRGGATSSRELPIHGEEWAWTEAIAPRMAIEGRFLREFLDWMARERGLGLQFRRNDLAASASTIRLNGSIEGLTLDQALESVLLTCGMRHRIEGGLLVVEAPDGPAL